MPQPVPRNGAYRRHALDDADQLATTREAIAKMARKLADAFKTDNPIFRYDEFFGACGLDQWAELMSNPVLNNGIGDQ